jgi:hypothetical protein
MKSAWKTYINKLRIIPTPEMQGDPDSKPCDAPCGGPCCLDEPELPEDFRGLVPIGTLQGEPLYYPSYAQFVDAFFVFNFANCSYHSPAQKELVLTHVKKVVRQLRKAVERETDADICELLSMRISKYLEQLSETYPAGRPEAVEKLLK